MRSLSCKGSHLLCKRTCLLGPLIRVTYLNTSAFTLYLIPFCLWRLRKAKIEPFEELSRYFVTSRLTFIGSPQCVLVRSAEEHQPLVVSEATGEADIGVHPRSSNVPLDHHELPLDVYQTAELAFVFCLLWFVANWSVNASLDYTSVASATILTSTSGVYTQSPGSSLGFINFMTDRFLYAWCWKNVSC